MDDSEKKQQRKPSGYGRGQHPNSRRNLQPVQPGEVRNPQGRIPGTLERSTIFGRWLEVRMRLSNLDTQGNPRFVGEPGMIECTLHERAALGQLEAAIKGNTQAWKEIQDSLHGKQAEKTDLTSNGQTVLTSLTVNVIKRGSDD